MSKLLNIAAAWCFAPLAVFSAMDDIVFAVKTAEKCVYSDSAPVGDGGKYVVTWTSGTNTFAGFNVDGSLVSPETSKILAEMKSKDSKLPMFLLQIDKGLVSGGTYQLSLLDTRVRDSRTGEFEGSEDGEVRSYSELVSDFKYTSQFSVMQPSGGQTEFKTAAGYVEKPFVPDTTPEPGYLPAAVASAGYSDSVEFAGSYTNSYTVFDAVSNTETRFYDIYRMFDVVRTKTVVRSIEVPVFVTNVVDAVAEAMPETTFKKTSKYSGFAESGDEAYAATVTTYKPNSYGLMRAVLKTKIGKKSLSKTFYGMVDDDDCATMYGNTAGCRLRFTGKYVDGTIVYNGIEYRIVGEFEK